MKRLFMQSALLLTATSLVLAGCGGNNKANSNASNASPSQSAATSTPSSDASGEKVKLTFGSWRTDDVAVYEKVIAAFNKKYPNIQIEFTPTKSTEYNTVLSTQLQAGEGPDIIHLRPYAAGIALGDAGYIEPINGLPGLDAIDPTFMEAATNADGKVYGVPMAVNTVAIMYNKKIFADNNLTPPTTWDEFIAVAQKLKDKKITPIAFGAKDGWILSMTQGAIGPAAYGGNDFAAKLTSGAAKFTDQPYVDSISIMNELKPFFPDKFEGIAYEDFRTMFAMEQAGMYILGDFDIAPIKALNPAIDIGVFAVPSKTGGKPTVSTYVDGSYAVNAKSKHKEEAKKFLEFATTTEFGNLFANELNRVSPIPGVVNNDPLEAEFAKLAASSATPYLMVTNFNAGNPTTKSTLETNLQAMYLGQSDPAKVANEIQKSVDTWFKK